MENLRNIQQNNPVKCVLDNMVDKDVQLMLWPLNLTQLISITPRYRIKNNYITPNSFISNFFSMIAAIVFNLMHIILTYMTLPNEENLGYIEFMTVTSITDCMYYCFGFTLNFVNGIIQTKNNIRFILIYQRVHRFLNNETSFNNLIIWNWIMVIMAFSCHTIIVFFFCIQLALSWIHVFIYCVLVVFDLNVVNAIRVIKLLQNKLELWNIKILNSFEMEETRSENFCKRMFQAHADILECYDIFKVCFQPYILYDIIEAFFHSLIYMQVTISALKESFMNNTTHQASLSMLFFLTSMSKILTWQTMFMQQCETFYLTIQSAGDTCVIILKSNPSDEKRKLCKNVLRLHRASFSKMRVCGLFYADVASQLNLMGLLVNYTIVLLQFAFL